MRQVDSGQDAVRLPADPDRRDRAATAQVGDGVVAQVLALLGREPAAGSGGSGQLGEEDLPGRAPQRTDHGPGIALLGVAGGSQPGERRDREVEEAGEDLGVGTRRWSWTCRAGDGRADSPAPGGPVGVGVVGGRALRHEGQPVGEGVGEEELVEPLSASRRVEVVSDADHDQSLDRLLRSCQWDLQAHARRLRLLEFDQPAEVRPEYRDAVGELDRRGVRGSSGRNHERVAHGPSLADERQGLLPVRQQGEGVGAKSRGQRTDLRGLLRSCLHSRECRWGGGALRLVGGPEGFGYPGRSTGAHRGHQQGPGVLRRLRVQVPHCRPVGSGSTSLLVVDPLVQGIDVNVVGEDAHAEQGSVGRVAGLQSHRQQRNGFSVQRPRAFPSNGAARKAARAGGL